MMNTDYYVITGKFLEDERSYSFRSVSDFAGRAGTATPTIYRLFNGSPSTRPGTLRRIEKEFGWPDKSIDALRRGNIAWLEANDFPADSLRRYRTMVIEAHPDIQADTA